MFSGLNRKILYPLIFVFFATLSFSLFVSQFKARDVIQGELTERLQQEVGMAAKMIDNWLVDRKNDIKTWSLQEVFVEALTETGYYGKSAREGAAGMLALLKKGYPYYSVLFLTDISGNMIVSSGPSIYHGINVAKREYFQAAMMGKHVISEVILDMVTGNAVFTVNSPLIVDGKIVGMLSGAIQTQYISTLFVDDFKLEEKSYAYLLNNKGEIVSISKEHQQKKMVLITDDFFRHLSLHPDGQFIYEKQDDQYLNVFKQLNQTKWCFGISHSLDVTLRPLFDLARMDIVVSLISLFLGGVIMITMFRSLVLNRLRRILDGMEDVTKGNYKTVIPISHKSKDEITELSKSFNSMITQLDKMVGDLNVEISARKIVEEKLAAHQDDLESTIRTRTQELEDEIFQRKEVELKLARAEKMEMIGTLAGGVAHDLNNILSGIVSYPDFLLGKISENDSFYKPLQTIKKSGVRAAAIVQDLLTLARRGIVTTEHVDWNKLVNDYMQSPEFLKVQEEHPNITLKVGLDKNLSPIFGSPVHLIKTLMNLVLNGFEAMPEGGTLSIFSENIYIDKTVAVSEEMSEGHYVLIKVCDQGDGILPEDMGRIFEPFYTTKKMGKSGTGLGMAVVWATMRDHNGFINCESTVFEKTAFLLYFPVARQLKTEQQVASVPKKSFQGHGEHILVVDDVKEQREIASSILKAIGYQVTTAECGEEAVILCKDVRFDLLLLDMILGEGIDGLETYQAILSLRSNQRAIIVSGFSESSRIKQALALGAGKYIKKPYTVETIATAVRNEIDRRRK